MTNLHEAAEAVLNRWNSPSWEWSKQGPTADLMATLRVALAQQAQKADQDSPQDQPHDWLQGRAAWSLREAAEAALDALVSQMDGRADAITALRAGLSQTQSQSVPGRLC